MRLRLAEGKISEVVNLLAQMEREVEKINSPVYNTTVDLCKGYVFACLGQPERIPSWLQIGEIKASDFFSQGIVAGSTGPEQEGSGGTPVHIRGNS